MIDNTLSISKNRFQRWPLLVAMTLVFTTITFGQPAKCRKWSYDFSETVRYFDAALAACQSYVKEKYPDDNYKAAVEATNDPETFRCSAGDTYIGLVYQRECENCCAKKPRSSPDDDFLRLMPHPLSYLLFGEPGRLLTGNAATCDVRGVF